MKQLFPLSCLLLGLICVCFHGSAAKTYSGARSQLDCPQGTPPSACAKRYLMFPFPRVGRGSHEASFPRAQRVFGIVKQPRIGRSDPSLAQPPDSQRIYDDQSNLAADLTDYQRAAPPAPREDYSTSLDNYPQPAPRSMSPWAFFLITPNFHNTEHAMDHLMLPQMAHQLDNANEE